MSAANSAVREMHSTNYLQQRRRFQINNLSSYHKNLEKEEQNKPKQAEKRQKIIMSRN